ncbi:MAG: GNAT family N-acetyltransferase [Actinomycetes bacterium]
MSTTSGGDGVLVRDYEPADEPGVLELMRTCLGWRAEDPNEAFFRWKHQENPFGTSPAWVAVDQGQIVGFRAFLRWEFTDGERVVRAVRAVDTATAASHRGRGIFRRLTEHGLAAVRAEGVDLVFNTPNDQSRPGYLRMGWQVVGRVPVAMRPRGLRSLVTVARARQAAEIWSQPSPIGVPVDEWLDRVGPAAVHDPARDGQLVTRRTEEFLRWRYGMPDLQYRIVWTGADPTRGTLVLRVRRRGPAQEAAILDQLAGVPADGRRTLGSVLRGTGADYAIWLGGQRPGPMLPLPGQGPILTARAASGSVPDRIPGWGLRLGDVELF